MSNCSLPVKFSPKFSKKVTFRGEIDVTKTRLCAPVSHSILLRIRRLTISLRATLIPQKCTHGAQDDLSPSPPWPAPRSYFRYRFVNSFLIFYPHPLGFSIILLCTRQGQNSTREAKNGFRINFGPNSELKVEDGRISPKGNNAEVPEVPILQFFHLAQRSISFETVPRKSKLVAQSL